MYYKASKPVYYMMLSFFFFFPSFYYLGQTIWLSVMQRRVDLLFMSYLDPFFNFFFPIGPPMPSSSSSPSVTEHLHSPPPSPNLHDNQRWLLSNNANQPVQDSDTDEDYTASSFLVQTGTVSVSVPGHGKKRTLCPQFEYPFIFHPLTTLPNKIKVSK